MLSIRTIVQPINFVPADHAALQHAAHFARYHGAALHVIHVAPPMGPFPAYDAHQARDAALSYEQAMCGHVAGLVRSFVRAAGITGVHVVPAFIPNAVPATGIVAYARDVDADLLVTGAHGGRGPWAPMLGHVAEAVVRNAPCPVLVIRPEGGSPNICRVVAALELTPADEATAAYAVGLAEVYDAPLELLHVVAADEEEAGAHRQAEGMETAAEATLRNLCRHLIGAEQACVRVEAGFPPDVVVANAGADCCQLLVLGRRGPAFIPRLDLHGVAEKALRTVPCSVFIVPANRKDPHDTTVAPAFPTATVEENVATGMHVHADMGPAPFMPFPVAWRREPRHSFRPLT